MEAFLLALSQSYSAVFFRALGMFTLLPIGPATRKIWFSALLAFWVSGYVPYATQRSGFWVLTELLAGLSLALPLLLVISGGEMVGSLIDSGRGQNMARMYDMQEQTEHSIFATLLRYWVWAVVLQLGICEILMANFMESFEVIGAGHFPLSSLSTTGSGLVVLISRFFAVLLFVASPFAVIYLLVDLGFGFLGRLVPGVMLHGEASVLKSGLTLVVLYRLSDWGLEVSLLEFARAPLTSLELVSREFLNGS
mgnify:CR=1 FL=1